MRVVRSLPQENSLGPGSSGLGTEPWVVAKEFTYSWECIERCAQQPFSLPFSLLASPLPCHLHVGWEGSYWGG